MKDTLCIGGGHSHHQFGVNLVGFHAIIFTVLVCQIIEKKFRCRNLGRKGISTHPNLSQHHLVRIHYNISHYEEDMYKM